MPQILNLSNLFNNKVQNQKIFDFWSKRITSKHLKILDVDFGRSWLFLFIQQWPLYLISISQDLINWISWNLLPIILGFSISNRRPEFIVYFIIFRLSYIPLSFYLGRFANIFIIRSGASIRYHANKFFLTVDPLFNTIKSTGENYSKVNRSSNAFVDFVDLLTYQFLNPIVSIVTMVITFAFFNFWLSLIIFIVLMFITFIGIIQSFFINRIFTPQVIKTGDQVSDVELENLQQSHWIRSVFATDMQMKKLGRNLNLQMRSEYINNWVGNFLWYLIFILYFLLVLIIFLFLYQNLNDGKINETILISLLATFFLSTNDVLNLGSSIRRIVTTSTKVSDLWKFIRNYGKSSYPVI